MGFDKDSYDVARQLCRAFVARCDKIYGDTHDDQIREHAVNFFIGCAAAARLTDNMRLATVLERFIMISLTKPNSLTAIRHLALLGILPE